MRRRLPGCYLGSWSYFYPCTQRMTNNDMWDLFHENGGQKLVSSGLAIMKTEGRAPELRQLASRARWFLNS
jgi:hypothetical protein